MTPYYQGRLDRQLGKSFTENPFEGDGEDIANAWECGWCDEQEAEERAAATKAVH